MVDDGSEPRRPPPADRERWVPVVAPDDPRHPSVSDTAATAWDGVVWGRLGRADEAWRCWDAVRDPALLPWLAAERGRVLRELGLHAAARELELAGLEHAQDVTDVVMLRLGLAADALGAGPGAPQERVDRAGRLLDLAVGLLDELPAGPRTSRQRLRARWIGVEVAIARGHSPDDEGLPWRGDDGPAYPVEHDDGTDFHRAKGLLFAGVVRRDRWLLDRAAELAPPALRWAVQLARVDAGAEDAAVAAGAVWRSIVAPPPYRRDVAATPTAQRLRNLA